MSTISRRLPNSNKTRNEALQNAKSKKDSLPPVVPLSPDTITRLDAIEPAYKAAINDVKVKEAELGMKTAEKNQAASTARLFISNFIQTFNNGVATGIFPKAHRAYYNLDQNSSAVPYLGSEQALKTVGQAIIDGDANRIAAGGAPMAIPDIGMVTDKFNTFMGKASEHSNLADALDMAQEAVAALNAEADGVVKKVWDEVETYYNEEDKESQRANAREWGVVYITVGAVPATVTVSLQEKGTGTPLEGDVYLDGPDLTIAVDASGTASAETDFIGSTNATATVLGYVSETQPLVIEEGGSYNLLFELTAVVP